jgi:glycosyltransferase involved in cell wall biosynthesis
MNNTHNNKINLIFSIYPLTQKFRDNLESFKDEEYKYIELSTIRKKGAIGAVTELRQQKCNNLILASESVESEGLISVLKSFALISKAKSIFLLSPQYKLEEISRWKIISSLLQILSATFSGFYALLYAFLEMRMFKKKPSKETQLKRDESVLYLNMNLWYGVKVGGSVGHIAGVVNELNRDGYSVSYAAISDSSVIDPEVNRILLNSAASFGLPPEINSYRFDLFNYKTIKKIADRIKPSFIYQRLSVCSYTGAKLADRLKIPLIVEYNGSEVWIARNWGRPLIFEKIAIMAEELMLKRANVVVTISEVLKDELIERGVDPSKIVYYPNCIDPEFFDSRRFDNQEFIDLKMSFGLLKETRLITFLGTFGQWHGVEVFAKSIVDLVNNHRLFLEKYNVRFMLIGDGLKMGEVRDIILKGNAIQYCVFTGLVDQNKAPLFLAASDILVSPHIRNTDGSRFFGSPTKLFEYLAMGKPIIASDLEQIGEVLKNSIRIELAELDEEVEYNKRVAYLTEPGNYSEISAAILNLLARPKLMTVLSVNSRALAEEKYTWKKHVEAILSKI